MEVRDTFGKLTDTFGGIKGKFDKITDTFETFGNPKELQRLEKLNKYYPDAVEIEPLDMEDM